MSFLKGGMDLPKPEKDPLEQEERAVLDKLAKKVTEKGFTVPAILFLESIKPLNYISSQALVFFEPIVQTVFNFKDYDNFRCALEKRESIEILILLIEEYDATVLSRDKRIKKYLKEQKKTWKWYQRYLGIFTPRFKVPDEILNPPELSKPPDQDNPDSKDSDQ